MEIRFCFRLGPEAGFAYDSKTNEPISAYSQIKLGDAKKLPKNYEESHEIMRQFLAEKIGVDSAYVTPITQAEYDENVYEDEEFVED